MRKEIAVHGTEDQAELGQSRREQAESRYRKEFLSIDCPGGPTGGRPRGNPDTAPLQTYRLARCRVRHPSGVELCSEKVSQEMLLLPRPRLLSVRRLADQAEVENLDKLQAFSSP